MSEHPGSGVPDRASRAIISHHEGLAGIGQGNQQFSRRQLESTGNQGKKGNVQVMMRSFLALPILTAALLVAGCTDSSSTPSVTSAATSTPSSSSPTPRERSERLPDPVDPESFAKTTPDNPAQLPQLIGLTEDEAREWAELSGFTLVNRADGYPDVFAPTQRILVDTDENGIVTSATAS